MHGGQFIYLFFNKKKKRNWNKNIEATECQTNFILMSQQFPDGGSWDWMQKKHQGIPGPGLDLMNQNL